MPRRSCSRGASASTARTRAYLNGRAATVAELRELGAALVSFYGQHEHRKLTLAAAQLRDPRRDLRARAGAATARLRRGFAQSAPRCRASCEELRELAGARERELDLLEHELAEIDSAAPDQDEHERLLARPRALAPPRRAVLGRGRRRQALAPDSSEGSGVATLLAAPRARLDALAGVDPRL